VITANPVALRLPELLHLTDRVAADVAAGHYDTLLPPGGVPADQRWFCRVHGDDDVDVWLISWVPAQATELHDHGDSRGALTMLTGSVDEFRWDGSRLRRRRLEAGDQASFPKGWIHDVVWAPAPGAVSSTLSVHAYSPPLTQMSYYRVGNDALAHQRTVATDEPEKRP
jgi:hypothetical protein